MVKIVVDNTQYFRAVECQVRKYMKKFETPLLPIAEQAVKDAGFTVEEHPKEGYYNETPELRTYFDCLRTLQENFTDKITPSIQKLHDIYTNSIFGLEQGKPTAINPDAGLPFETPVTISPMLDPVSVASYHTQPNWTIERIMKELEGMELGICLVGLGVLVDKGNKNPDGSYNPLATCMACETTVLSRMKIAWKGLRTVDWQVSKDVEKFGNKVIEEYSNLMTAYGDPNLRMPLVTPENVLKILDEAPRMERCVNLNIIDIPGKPKQYYHWAIISEDTRYRVVDFFKDRIITTQEFISNPSIIGL